MIPEPPTAPRERLAWEIERVADRLRSMPLARLARCAPAARSVAQVLADLAADAEGRSRRPVPDVGDPAVGDQVAVTGADLLRAGAADPVLHRAADELSEVRRLL